MFSRGAGVRGGVRVCARVRGGARAQAAARLTRAKLCVVTADHRITSRRSHDLFRLDFYVEEVLCAAALLANIVV